MSKNEKTKYTNMLLASFMLFIFPIILVFAGVFIGGLIGKHLGTDLRTFQIIGGLAAFVLAVIIIKFFDKSAKVDENAEKIYWDDM